MNKKLVAVAIAGLLAAPLAQAQTANVTLYGRVNLDMEFVNGRHGQQHQPERLSRHVELVAFRPSRHGVARWWSQCDLPDGERLDQRPTHGSAATSPAAIRSSA